MAKAKRGFTFDYIESRKPNFSKFNLSHDHLAALGSGKIVPLWWTNAVPGDRFTCNVNGFMRLLALSSPMLQREDITLRAFKIPWRILANRKDLDIMYAGDKDGHHIDIPWMSWDYDDLNVGSLADYLGIPLPYVFDPDTKSWSKMPIGHVNSLPEGMIFPVLAYHRICHDHFRNEETENSYLDLFEHHYENLDGLTSSEPLVHLDADAPEDVYLGQLRNVCWERDYFTSALSSTQRGSQVSIPLLGNAPVKPNPNGNAPIFRLHTGENDFQGSAGVSIADRPPTDKVKLTGETTSEGQQVLHWEVPNLVVDGSEFSGIGAIALRMAMNLQAFLERNNVAGYRMIGNILAHFGVRSSNKQMDEAEYLGGIKAPITISAVTQTSATMDALESTPQGTQVGQAQAQFADHLFSTFCEEPCILMVVGYITARSSYSQGLARKWLLRSYFDLYWPEFQTVGEQEILNKEIFFDYQDLPEEDRNSGTWAYQSRYAEYKYEPDSIAGDFRTTLSYWHQSRLFTQRPSFNNSFVECNPSDRVFALDTETFPRPYLGEFYFDVQSVRPMDKYPISRLW